jgi:hypothetical protein
VQSAKDIRAKAHGVLKDMSTGLQDMAESEGTKRWEGVVDACKSSTGPPEVRGHVVVLFSLFLN